VIDLVDFTELAYDIIGGPVVGGLASAIEYTLASAAAALPGSFLLPSEVVPFAVVTGALGFAGAFLMKIGSKTVKGATS
jgi:hypothetical protein